MRLIDADELKKCVLKWLPQDPCGREEKEFPFETDICVSMLMEIDEQPTITPEPHWIPVAERLPEEDGDYLVTFEEGYAEDYGFDPIGIAPFEVDCEGFGIWQEHFDRHTLGSLGSDWVEIKVIAWMPMPESYKG